MQRDGSVTLNKRLIFSRFGWSAAGLLLAQIAALALVRAEELSPQLAEIEALVTQRTHELEQLSTERTRLQGIVDRYRDLLKQMEGQRSALQGLLDQTARDRELAENSLRENSAHLENVAKTALIRIKLMYMHRERSPLEMLISARANAKHEAGSDAASIERSAWYLTKIAQNDQTLVERLHVVRRELEVKTEKIARLTEKQSELQQRMVGKKAELERERDEQRKAAAAMTEQEARVEATIAELRAQALRLETVVTSITEQPATVTVKSADSEKPEPGPKPFSGAGLEILRGKLALPVQGKAISTFGKSKDRAFKDFIFSRGVEFKTKIDAEVQAVADGRVMYLGRMPGYGTLLILDHGARSYSLYGRIANAKVEQGDVVNSGQVIANAETEGAEGAFYFEIRKDAKPVNPEKYFAKKFNR